MAYVFLLIKKKMLNSIISTKIYLIPILDAINTSILIHMRRVTAGILLGIGCVSIFFITLSFMKKNTSDYPPPSVATAPEKHTENDSDGDGVEDWRELLLETDTQDSQDFPSPSQLTTNLPEQHSIDPSLPVVERDSIAHHIMKESMDLYNTDKEGQLDQFDQIVEKVVDVIHKKTSQDPIEIAVMVQENADTVEVLRVLNELIEQIGSEPEMTLVSKVLTGDEGAREKLARIANIYKQYSETLRTLPVPPTIAPEYKKFIERITIIHTTLTEFLNNTNDPIVLVKTFKLFMQELPLEENENKETARTLFISLTQTLTSL